MDSMKIQNKLKLLFKKFSDPTYVLDNYYADEIINKLCKGSDHDVSKLGTLPLLSDLITEALDHIDNVSKSVKVFLIKVLAIASHKELHFDKMILKQGDRILAGFKQVCAPNVNPSIRVAFMDVALAIVTHNSGITWLLKTGVWKEILSLCYQKSTVFVVRQIYKFMSEFLWKLNDLDDITNIRITIGLLLHPISKYDFINVQSWTSEEEEEMCRTIEPSIQILLATLSKEHRIETSSLLVNALVVEFKMSSYLCVTYERVRTEDKCLEITKLLFWLTLAKVFNTKPYAPGVLYSSEDFLEVAAYNFNVVQSFVQRRNVNLVVDFCTASTIIWNTVCKDMEPHMWAPEEQSKPKLRNQMLVVILAVIMQFVTRGKTRSSITDMRFHDYITKMMNCSCEHTLKAAYAVRGLCKELDSLSIILQTAKKLLYLKNHLNNEQANLVFQALFHVLQEYNPKDENGDLKVEVEETYEECDEKNLIIAYVMDSVLCLVTHRNIHWQESVEIMGLYNVVSNILNRSSLSCKFVVVALKVIALTVKKSLQPNLSLLMDSQPGSSICELGNIIYMKMQDRNWEIRDTALELLQVVTENSYVKFPPFQKQILELRLINVAATIAFNDYESYVQVSALKCVGTASRITVIWENVVAEFPDIEDRLLSILRNNEEGIVRKEACNVLCDLYQNIKLSPAFKQTLYEHMVSSALTDFHWEVQVSALRFWKIVYQSLLTGQGMLDGTFPPVTFSGESRKIVTLNKAEIQKRLIKILEELSTMGCLTVFVSLLNDDTEVEIMDATFTTCQELFDILLKYKVPECLTPKGDEISSVHELILHIKEEKYESDDVVEMADVKDQDNVIEDILNAADINLLSSIYERHMSLQGSKTEKPLKPKIKLTKFASPYLFVNYLKTNDFKQIIEEKRKWNIGIRSMSSLLDDVLGLYEGTEEVNSLDCY